MNVGTFDMFGCHTYPTMDTNKHKVLSLSLQKERVSILEQQNHYNRVGDANSTNTLIREREKLRPPLYNGQNAWSQWWPL